MVHGDNNGLVLPPKVAPTQVMIVPIQQAKEGVLDKAFEVKVLSNFRVKVDDSGQISGMEVQRVRDARYSGACRDRTERYC